MRFNTDLLQNSFEDLAIADVMGKIPLELAQEWVEILTPAKDENERKQQVFSGLCNDNEQQDIYGDILAVADSQFTAEAEVEAEKKFSNKPDIRPEEKTRFVHRQVKQKMSKLKGHLIDKMSEEVDRLFENDNEALILHHRMSNAMQITRDNRQKLNARTGYSPTQVDEICRIFEDFVKAEDALLYMTKPNMDKSTKQEMHETGIPNVVHSGRYQLKI